MKKTLKVGDKVMWKGAWGTQLPKETTIEGIELCKNGVAVEECDFNNYQDCVFDLTNGHWCYGYQIDWKASIALNNE